MNLARQKPTALVLGCGPSILSFTVGSLAGRLTLVACNRAIEFVRAIYWVWVEPPHYERSRHHQNARTAWEVGNRECSRGYHRRALHFLPSGHLPCADGELYLSGGSLTVAAHFAARIGARRIVFVACDAWSPARDRYHTWDTGALSVRGRVEHEQHLAKTAHGIQALAQQYRGVEFLDATAGEHYLGLPPVHLDSVAKGSITVPHSSMLRAVQTSLAPDQQVPLGYGKLRAVASQGSNRAALWFEDSAGTIRMLRVRCAKSNGLSLELWGQAHIIRGSSPGAGEDPFGRVSDAVPRVRRLLSRRHLAVTYRCPDVSFPCGGVRTIFRHVRILQKAGIEARVLAPTSDGLSRWLNIGAASVLRELPPDSIVVVPEVDPRALQQPGRKVVLAQSTAFAEPSMPKLAWKEYGVEAAIVVSRYVRSTVLESKGFDAAIIAPSIDHRLFHPLPKRRVIAFMPRKNPDGHQRILNRLRPGGPSPLPIDGVPLRKVGLILGESAIFLWASPREGFGLPPLEAMACGCIVVGYAGGGGLDFMEAGINCLLARDGDENEAVELLEEAVRMLDDGRSETMVDNALKTARRFCPEREARDLVRYWSRFLSRDAASLAQHGVE